MSLLTVILLCILGVGGGHSAVLDFQLQRRSTQTVTQEWVQHAHDAQRTGYTPQTVPTPWRWKWAWNGPNASGGIISGKTRIGHTVQPITGGGRVYIARGYWIELNNGNITQGTGGVTALSENTGGELWTVNPGGSIVTTPAYDTETDTLYAVSTNGYLYRLNAANGGTIGSFNAGSPMYHVPPCLLHDRVIISAGTRVYALHKSTLGVIWSYNAGVTVETCPAYSVSRDYVVVGSSDLYVHCIRNSDGSRVWRAKPTPMNPADSTDRYPFRWRDGWPVIADIHGYVLMKMRIDERVHFLGPYPVTNAQLRARFTNNPGERTLFVMDLDDGSTPFLCNVGGGNWGNGGSWASPGPMPVVKHFPNGDEVVYCIGRGSTWHNATWDSAFVEMVLDSHTVSGYQGGDIRFINYVHPPGSSQPYLLTDEQPNPTMSGDVLFGGHWSAGLACVITNRSAPLGAFSPLSSRIQATYAPHIVTAQQPGACPFSPTHYCDTLTQDDDPRQYPAGFYIYYDAGTVYDTYWRNYACWTVSNNTVYFLACCGALVALEQGN